MHVCLKNGLLRVNQDQLRQKKHNFFPFLWTPLSWLIEKHFLSAKIKSWQDGQPGSALVWFLAQAITSPLLFNNGGNINYRFVRINTVCRREGEEENREAYLEWGCACPVLANYILTKHFKGSYENQSKPGCQWTPSNTVVTDAISLCFYWLTSSDLLLSSSSFFEVVSTVAALVVSTDFLKKRL